MVCLALKHHLLSCIYCVILILFSFSLHTSLTRPVYLLQLSSSLHMLSVTVRFLCPSLLPGDGLSFCLFIILLNPSLHLNTHTHTLRIPLSFRLSSSAILTLSSFFSLSISSKNSINLKLQGIFHLHFIYEAAVAIIFILLISALSTVHNLDRNILS